ncbi:cytidylyltransferase domain-containing protein [Roseivirga pacifica]|uniref:cytidylyltransferase domain-containing protein n=1 Tax=Roseivirga pacifica TaxID=1267423 RepID=UPI00227B91AD|nr:hypothetical protein [Roseivirga pacifica]
MAKVVACIIARTTSTRLPLKVLRESGFNCSMLSLLINRLKSVEELDEIYICTSHEPVDDIMEDIAEQHEVKVYRGSPDKVIERMIAVAELTKADILLRITGDNPLTSIEYIPYQIEWLLKEKLEYVRVADIPIGGTAEVIERNALERCYNSIDASVSEYLLLFIFDPNEYKCGIVRAFSQDYSALSFTVDTPADYQRLRVIANSFIHLKDKPHELTLKSLLEFYNNTPDLPAREMKMDGNVKLPYGKEVTYAEFKRDMNLRASNSKELKLY